MPLRTLEVAGFRGVREGRVTFGDATILFGENDSGRSSLIAALALVLGALGDGDPRPEPRDFHRLARGRTDTVRIRLELEEGAPDAWAPPTSLVAVLPPAGGRRRRLAVELTATLDETTGSVTTRHHAWAAGRPGVRVEGDDASLAWVRGVFPMLWLRPGELTDQPDGETGGTGDALDADPAIRIVEAYRRRILAGDTSDMPAVLEAGARAAQEVIDRFPAVFAGSGPVMSALASEILDRDEPGADVPAPAASTPAQRLAVLLLLGAVAGLAKRALSHGPLPTGARPILVVENPEANLHPTTLASVWRLVQGMAWQTVVATHSGHILADAPLVALRRLTRSDGVVREWRVEPDALDPETMRKVAYHLRSRRNDAMFARVWILVEGETEHWVIPELARVLGYDLAREGVACVEFAQCGLAPLLALADQLGIAAHVLVDGDEAGRQYIDAAVEVARSPEGRGHPLTMLRDVDLEHALWRHGFADVIRGVARLDAPSSRDRTIRKAIEKTSKPFLALSIIDAAARRGPSSVPAVLAGVIESAIHLARR